MGHLSLADFFHQQYAHLYPLSLLFASLLLNTEFFATAQDDSTCTPARNARSDVAESLVGADLDQITAEKVSVFV